MVSTKYKTILIDPPWYEKGGGKIKRGADRHYNLLKTRDMPKVIYQSGVFESDDNCHLYLWVTNNFLKDGLWLMEALGFRYITKITWIKGRLLENGLIVLENPGLGQYFRGLDEILLFGTKGHIAAKEKMVTVLVAPRSKEHSEKPEKIFDIIEAVSPPPYLELFARSRRQNWDSWGDEVPNEIQPKLFA